MIFTDGVSQRQTMYSRFKGYKKIIQIAIQNNPGNIVAFNATDATFDLDMSIKSMAHFLDLTISESIGGKNYLSVPVIGDNNLCYSHIFELGAIAYNIWVKVDIQKAPEEFFEPVSFVDSKIGEIIAVAVKSYLDECLLTEKLGDKETGDR